MGLFLRLFLLLAFLFIGYEVFALVRLWFQARMAGVHISGYELLRMELGKAHAPTVLDAYIRASKAQLNVPVEALEELAILGGDAESVVQELIRAKAGGQSLSFKDAANKHLANRPSPVMKVFQGRSGKPRGRGHQ